MATTIEHKYEYRCIYKISEIIREECINCEGKGLVDRVSCPYYIPTKKAILPKEVSRNWKGFINDIRKYNDDGVI